jgi:hypothetical protein
MDILAQWCNEQGMLITQNNEVFFVDEKLLMKPEYVINKKIYIDLVDDNELTDKYLEFCRLFSSSFGTIIVIPRSALSGITSVTRKDIENRFNIKF